jgi:hypothetical protein
MRHLRKNTIRSFIDRELSENRRKDVETHLGECPRCQSLVENVSREIDFVKKQIDYLAPEEIPSQIPPLPGQSEKKGTSAPFFYRLIFSSVRVPSVVLIMTGSIILILSVLLYSGSIKAEKYKPQHVIKETISMIELISPTEVDLIPLDFEISEFTLIENPNILVLRGDEE